jgi:hypothetical protein
MYAGRVIDVLGDSLLVETFVGWEYSTNEQVHSHSLVTMKDFSAHWTMPSQDSIPQTKVVLLCSVWAQTY